MQSGVLCLFCWGAVRRAPGAVRRVPPEKAQCCTRRTSPRQPLARQSEPLPRRTRSCARKHRLRHRRYSLRLPHHSRRHLTWVSPRRHARCVELTRVVDDVTSSRRPTVVRACCPRGWLLDRRGGAPAALVAAGRAAPSAGTTKRPTPWRQDVDTPSHLRGGSVRHR